MKFIDKVRFQAKKRLRTIVFPEGHEKRTMAAANILVKEKIVKPILLGNEGKIRGSAKELKTDLNNIEIVEPPKSPNFDKFVETYYKIRQHKGMTAKQAKSIMLDPLYFGAMMVKENLAAGAVAGSIHTTGDVLRAAIQIVGLMDRVSIVSSSFLMLMKDGQILTFADCAVIPEPTPEQLVSITLSSARTHERLVGDEPKIAMLSFSTKGSAKHRLAYRVIEATKMVKDRAPHLKVDGELQFDAAYASEVGKRKAPDSPVAGQANVFIFPDLNSANIGYKMVQRLAGAEAIGPIIQGLARPYNDLSRGCSVDDIVNVAAICSILA
jgi:phosphate acetyltransferase